MLAVPRSSLAVTVVGGGPLVRQLVMGPLERQGLLVLEAGSPPPEGVANMVAVLIDPTSREWSATVRLAMPRLVVLVDGASDDDVVDLVLKGAEAVVTAEADAEEVLDAIATVADGGTVLSPTQARALAELARRGAGEGPPVDPLTRRELEILHSIDRGETVKQTARSLGISAKTVENLQSRLFRKLSVRNRAQAVSRAHDLGILVPVGGPPPDRAGGIAPSPAR